MNKKDPRFAYEPGILFYTYHTMVHPRLRSTAVAPIDQQQQLV